MCSVTKNAQDHFFERKATNLAFPDNGLAALGPVEG
jgi:hypothetical protein